MNPNYNQTITVYSKSKDEKGKDAWTRQVFQDCFFKASTGIASGGGSGTAVNLYSKNVYVARIPEEAGNVQLHEGDIIVKGEVSEEITSSSPNTATELLKRYQPNAFRVTSFSDNTNFPVDGHYRAGG